MDSMMMTDMMKSMPADKMMGMDMAKCSSMCMNMADVATTMMRMMMRPMGMDMMSMRAMMTACIEMGKACSAECMMHADRDEQCRMCAKACDAMVMACEKAMGSMQMA